MKAMMTAAGQYVDPSWTKERLAHELYLITQASAMSAYLRRTAAEDGEKQQLEHALMAGYRRGAAPEDLLPKESQDHLTTDGVSRLLKNGEADSLWRI